MSPAEFSDLHSRAFAPDMRGWRAAEFEQLLNDPKTIWTGDHRAFVLARMVLDEVEILTVVCDPAHQRRGLASVFLSELMIMVQARGAQRMFLEVASDNEPALALYAKVGFDRVGVRTAYYRRAGGDPMDAILLEKNLTSCADNS